MQNKHSRFDLDTWSKDYAHRVFEQMYFEQHPEDEPPNQAEYFNPYDIPSDEVEKPDLDAKHVNPYLEFFNDYWYKFLIYAGVILLILIYAGVIK